MVENLKMSKTKCATCSRELKLGKYCYVCETCLNLDRKALGVCLSCSRYHNMLHKLANEKVSVTKIQVTGFSFDEIVRAST